jgi:phosphatidylglycerophosphate synthase
METIKKLREICQQKTTPEHISMRFWRIFSIYFTKIFIIFGLKPNAVSVLGFLIGLVGGIFFIRQQFILGSICYVFVYIFDDVDGELARYYKKPSKFGGWLDVLAGHLLYPYFFLTLGLGVFFATNNYWYLFLSAVAAIAKMIERSIPQVKGLTDNEDVLKQKDISMKQNSWRDSKQWLAHFAKTVFIYPIALISSLFDKPEIVLWVFAFYLTFFALSKVILTGWRVYIFDR